MHDRTHKFWVSGGVAVAKDTVDLVTRQFEPTRRNADRFTPDRDAVNVRTSLRRVPSVRFHVSPPAPSQRHWRRLNSKLIT